LVDTCGFICIICVNPKYWNGKLLQWNRSKPNLLGTNFCASYIRTLSKGRFIQDFGLYRISVYSGFTKFNYYWSHVYFIWSFFSMQGHTPVMLHTQYRCHPHISRISNSLFYNNQLRDGVLQADRLPIMVGFLFLSQTWASNW
jgi:hypothetical protein